MKPQAKEWIEKAEEDLQAAKRLIRGRKPLYNLVCFHAQQSAEKYLKAFLEEKGFSIPRTHDLVALINIAQPELNFLLLQKDDLERITGYAVAFRYPGESATRKEAKQALEICSDLGKWIQPKLIQKNKQNTSSHK